MSAKYDEFPLLPFQDIKEKPKCHGREDGQSEISIPPPPTNAVCRGYTDAEGIANSADPDQTAPLHCLPRTICPKI